VIEYNKGPSPEDEGETKADIDQYTTELHRFFMSRVRNNQDADDLCQDLYLRFLQIPNKELIRHPRAYLYRIATNLLYEYSLRNRRDVPWDPGLLTELVESGGQPPSKNEPENQALASEELHFVLQKLQPTLRAVLILQKRDGLSYEEIGEKLGLSAHTVKKYLYRALALCRQAEWKR